MIVSGLRPLKYEAGMLTTQPQCLVYKRIRLLSAWNLYPQLKAIDFE
jgi:hypothetical protein